MKKRLGLPILMGRPPRGVNLTSTGYVLQDGTPYDPVKRKQENERAKAMRKGSIQDPWPYTVQASAFGSDLGRHHAPPRTHPGQWRL
eukprot:jgi/Chrpa1/21956/Chrysochromulina_OHIO_Genome00022671-RA